MLNESAQAMNEAESNLIRSPPFCPAPQPRKLENNVFLFSLILGDAIWFPMLTYHGGARDTVKYGHRCTLALSEECSKLRGIS